jgi:hypothetical protein
MRNPRQSRCIAAIAAPRRIEPLGWRQESGFSGVQKTVDAAVARGSLLASA